MTVSANHFLNRVVKWLKEGLGHLYDGSRYDLLLVTLKKLLLLMSQDLNFFKVRLTGSLSEDTFVLTAWSGQLVSHGWIVLGHRRDRLGLIILNFKIKLLERVKQVQVVKVCRWIRLYFFEERGNVCLILQWQLQHGLPDPVLVKFELKLNVCDVVL